MHLINVVPIQQVGLLKALCKLEYTINEENCLLQKQLVKLVFNNEK